MDMEKRCLQAGVMVILLAIFLRLMSTGAMAAFVEKPVVMSTILFLETGRWMGLEYPQEASQAPIEQTPAVPTQPQPEKVPFQEPAKAAFSSDDEALVEVNNVCGYGVDVQAMLSAPLAWDLTKEEPAVLILHSHGSESYKKTENYTESSAYRTLDTEYNVVSVGARLAEKLEAAGICVIHDTTVHDYPSYNDSYVQAREAIEKYLTEYPSIMLVLDIHRDAVEDSNGVQLGYSVVYEGQKTAQLMMVVGTDAGGRNHPNWQKNMALAVKLHVQLQKQTPGICRAISFRTQRFNQDLCPGGMLIEVGAAGNTRQEALLAADKLAEGIIALAHGTESTLY